MADNSWQQPGALGAGEVGEVAPLRERHGGRRGARHEGRHLPLLRARSGLGQVHPARLQPRQDVRPRVQGALGMAAGRHRRALADQAAPRTSKIATEGPSANNLRAGASIAASASRNSPRRPAPAVQVIADLESGAVELSDKLLEQAGHGARHRAGLPSRLRPQRRRSRDPRHRSRDPEGTARPGAGDPEDLPALQAPSLSDVTERTVSIVALDSDQLPIVADLRLPTGRGPMAVTIRDIADARQDPPWSRLRRSGAPPTSAACSPGRSRTARSRSPSTAPAVGTR